MELSLPSTLLVVTLFLLWSAALAGRATARTVLGEERRYLVPLMMYGPNNQLNAIKETMALARVLGWTVVLPDLTEHRFTDGKYGKQLQQPGKQPQEQDEPGPMRFRDLFDLQLVQSRVDAVLLDDLPDLLGGPAWNRTLDAALLLVRPDQMRVTADLARSLGLAPPPPERWLASPVTSWLGCSAARLEQLRALLRPYRVVGVQTFHGLLYGSQWLAGPMLMPCSEQCCRAFQETAPLVRKSEHIHAIAAGFVRERMGDRPYIAVHLRPYPDPCLKLWTQEDSPARQAKMDADCNNDYLINRFVPSIQHLMESYNVSTVFVMTHPMVRRVVQEMLGKAGVRAVFMELDDVRKAAEAPFQSSTSGSGAPQAQPRALASNVSFSLLAMVEEAVCALARAFVGTKESSMTGTIVQERLGAGLPPGDSYCFFRRAGFERRPVAVDHFYSQFANFTLTGTQRWRQKLGSKGVDVRGGGGGGGVEGARAAVGAPTA